MSKKGKCTVTGCTYFFMGKMWIQTGRQDHTTGITPNRWIYKISKRFYFMKTTYVNAYDLSEENLCKYLCKAKKGKSPISRRIAASLNALAKVALANNI
jgi:hypothetical protein